MIMRTKKVSSPIQNLTVTNPERLVGMVLPLPSAVSLSLELTIFSDDTRPFYRRQSTVFRNDKCNIVSAACVAWHVDTDPQYESFIAYASDVPSLAGYIVDYLIKTRLYDVNCDDPSLRSFGFFNNIYVADEHVFSHVRYLFENLYYHG